jgi:hypothetical protein
MTAEQIFKFARVYKLYYAGKYDFKKYKGNMKMPPLIKQPDRVYYHKLANKLTDAQVHALFLVGYFFNPNAHISNLVTPKGLSAAVEFATRGEKGREGLELGLYELSKTLADKNIDEWLYGEWIDGQRASMPECIQMTINGELPLDLAALLLLIPQPELHYNWTEHFKQTEEIGLGIGPWIQRLKKMDQLLVPQRPGWRMMAFYLAKTFWVAMAGHNTGTLAPISGKTGVELF